MNLYQVCSNFATGAKIGPTPGVTRDMASLLTELIEQTFNREGSLYLACNDKKVFFTSEQPKRYKVWSCQKMCDALYYLLDNIFIRFGSRII